MVRPMKGKQKNTESTLKKFRRHSHSPGVKELLNDRVKKMKISPKKRRRNCDEESRTFPIRSERSPMLDAAKCDVRSIGILKEGRRDTHMEDHGARRDEKFQCILGAVFSDPESQAHSEINSQEMTEKQGPPLKLTHRKCEVPPSSSPHAKEKKDIQLTCHEILSESGSESEDSIPTTSKSKSNDTSDRLLQAYSILHDGLEPEKIISIFKEATTISDRSQYLRNLYKTQSEAELEDYVSNDVTNNQQTKSTCSTKGSDDMFVIGEPATYADKERAMTDRLFLPGELSGMSPDFKPRYFGDRRGSPSSKVHLRRFSRHFTDVLSQGDGESRPVPSFRDNIMEDIDKAGGDCFIGSFFKHGNVETSCRLTDKNSFANQSPFKSPSFYRSEKCSSSVFNKTFLPLDSRSPAPEDFERLTNRALATVLDDDSKSPPNFFSVPFEMM